MSCHVETWGVPMKRAGGCKLPQSGSQDASSALTPLCTACDAAPWQIKVNTHPKHNPTTSS
eukprot:9067867-Pyramimonas_sp.AAC.1